MDLSSYAAAVVRALLLVSVVAVGAVGVRRRVLPSARGAEAHLAECVAGVALVVLAGQVLGSIGLLSYWPLLVVLAVVAVAVAGGPTRPDMVDGGPPRDRVRMRVLAVVGLSLVGALWVAALARSYRFGMNEIDSLRYHLPMAATFAQQHSISALHFLELDHLATTAPSNNELLGAVVMSIAGNDVFVPLLSVFWAAFALLAGWCLGRRAGIHWGGMVAVAVTLVVPLSAITAPAEATNDVAVVALLTAAIAFTPVERIERRAWFGAAAAGLAVATKLTAVVPVAVLAVAVLVRHRKHVRALLVPGLVVLVTGAYWYVRNIVAVGSPVPASDFALGPVRLSKAPDPVLVRDGFTIADRIGDADFIRVLPHYLDLALGPCWFVILGGALVGACRALVRGDAVARVVALVAFASAAAYVVTPYSAGGTRDVAWLTPVDVRFVYPGIALGLTALVMTARTPRTAAAVDAVLAVSLLSPLFAGVGPWRTVPREYLPAGFVALVVLGCALSLAVFAPSSRSALVGAGAVAAVLVLAAGYRVQHRYFDGRYVAASSSTHAAVDRWAQTVSGRNIAIVGLSDSYPLYGRELSNRVVYLGNAHGDGSFTSWPDCGSLFDAIDEGRFDYIVAGSFKSGLETAPERQWLQADDHARPLLTDGAAEVFEITGLLRPDGCGSAAGEPVESLPADAVDPARFDRSANLLRNGR